jgi:hypothetical protein
MMRLEPLQLILSDGEIRPQSGYALVALDSLF